MVARSARVAQCVIVLMSTGACSSHRVLQAQPERATPSGLPSAPATSVEPTEQHTPVTVAGIPAPTDPPVNTVVPIVVSDVFAETIPPTLATVPATTVPFSLVLDLPAPDAGRPTPTTAPPVPTTGQPTADPVALPVVDVGVGGPKVRTIRGTYDLDLLLVSHVPLVMNPLAGPAPLESVIGVVLAGSAAPAARPGDALLLSYQLLRWDTGEVADATAAGEPSRLILGAADELAPAFSQVLAGVTPGSQRIALFPAGTTGLPTYVPEDVAYLFVATISAVVPA